MRIDPSAFVATLKKITRLEQAAKVINNGQRATIGAIKEVRKQLSETGSRLIEVAAKTTRRFDALHEELRAVDLKTEIAEMTRRANASLNRIEGVRTCALDALYADYWDNHYTPLKAAYDAAVDRAREEFCTADAELHDVMTKKSLAIRKLEDKPESVAYKSARASCDRWKKSEFEPKRKANFATRDRAETDAGAAFDEANNAAYARYCAQHRKELEKIDPIVADVKEVAALCAVFSAGDFGAADAILAKANAETFEGISFDATITDSNGQRREMA